MYGPMVKLVDTGDLKSPAEKRTCSTQVRPTKHGLNCYGVLLG